MQTLAVTKWARAYPATDGHAHLLRKRVRAYGLRVAPTWEKRIRDEAGSWQTLLIEDVLLVPMRDWDGYLWNLQGIFPTKVETLGRDKDFLLGGRKQGLFFLIGGIDEAGTLVLVEGYATGCSVHVATGFPVLVCFDCGNLKAVAVEARRRFPTIDMVIAADNDTGTPGNPGLRHGREAALAARARLAFPTFDQEEAAA
ncbi:MAG: toprim domain-containing protein [Magnetococcus sp. DMHC-8]